MKKALSIILILILMFSLTVPVTAAEESVNYITNGNFEMGPGGQWGEIPGWTMNVPVGTMDLYIGNWYYDVGRDAFPSDTYIALRKEANPDGDEVSITQTITNLPVGVYEFSAWLWAATNTEYFTITLESTDDTAEIEAIPGVRDYDYAEIAVKDGSLTITIAADNVDKNRFMDALADDLKLVQIKGEEAFATPTPTPTPTPTEEPTATPSFDAEVSATIPAETSVMDNPKGDNGNSLVLPIILTVAGIAILAIVIILVVKKKKK